MTIAKKVLGCVFLMFGGMLLAHTFISAPYGSGVVAGYIITGVFFAIVFIYVGGKWTSVRIGGIKNDRRTSE